MRKSAPVCCRRAVRCCPPSHAADENERDFIDSRALDARKPYDLSATLRYRDYLRIWESNWGRSDGWDIELDGRVVAVMDEPRWEEMFWVSYRVTPTTDDAELRAQLVSEEFWKSDAYCKLVFRSRATGFVAEHAFPAIHPIVGPNRVNMRALYIPIGHPMPWDWLILKLRRLLRRRSRKRIPSAL